MPLWRIPGAKASRLAGAHHHLRHHDRQGRPTERAAAAAAEAPPGAPAPTPADLPLPEVSAGGLSGLLEILAARGGQDGLAELADDLSFEIDDLLPLVDAAALLGLTHLRDARLEITEAGRDFAAADIDTSKTLFGGWPPPAPR